MPEPLDADELRLFVAVISAGDLLQRTVAAQLAQHELSPLQFAILAELGDHAEGMRMRDLAEHLVVSRSGLTYQIRQLEQLGLVTRTSNADDERGVDVRLTPAGRARVEAALPGHVELVRAVLLDVVGPDEIAPLRATLEQVVSRLRARPYPRRSIRG